MTIHEFLNSLKEDPRQNSFTQTMAVIDENYIFTPTAFRNGKLENKAGENNGSCKIFSFAMMHGLDKDLTLACFGKYYFEEVLDDPEGSGHQNIRNFMRSGWEEISFKSPALQEK